MWKRFLLLINFIVIVIGGIACNQTSQASIESQVDAPLLTSSFVLAKEQVYQSPNGKFALDYPSNWTIYEGDRFGYVSLTPNEADFQPILDSGFRGMPPFSFHELGPYAGHQTITGNPLTAAEVAEETLGTFGEYKTLEPIKSVSINGYDGATFLVERSEGWHQYIVILRITRNTSIALDFLGPSDRSEEMQEILNAIALNICHLDKD